VFGGGPPRRARDQGMANFDADTLRELRGVRELRIRTGKHPKTAVVIWIVAADDEVFVRSWLGARGRWYRDLVAGGPATLEFAGHRIDVQAFPASDADSVARASAEFLRKYQPSAHARDGALRDPLHHAAARTALTAWINTRNKRILTARKPKPSAAPFTLDPGYKTACPHDGIEEGWRCVCFIRALVCRAEAITGKC